MTIRGSQSTQGYDYLTALTNLRDKIQELSTVQQQNQGQPTRLNSGLQFWRQNKSNIFFIFTMYAMSTASVISAVMAESRLQSDKLLDRHEQQQLKQSISRLQQQVQRQQQLIDSLRDTVEQHRPSWWRGTRPIQHQLLQQLQAWRRGDDLQSSEFIISSSSSYSPGSSSSSSSGASSSSKAPQPDREFGVRVGQLGRGFII